MHGDVGDELVVRARNIGQPDRKGEILEVLEEHGNEHYRVRWDDGHESLFFPSSDARIVHLEETRPSGRR